VKQFRILSLVGALLVAAPLAVGAQQASPPPAQPPTPPGFEIPKDMATYYLAIYVRGPQYTSAQTPAQMELTRSHLKYIRRMIEERKYVFAGPLLDGGDKQGVAIVSAASAAEARRLAEGDPAIAAGHMAVELHAAMLPSLSSLVVKY
jgi:uncharacterized protein YciI